MMRQSCLERQPALVDLKNGKYQFIYNQEMVSKPDPAGNMEDSWEYDFIEVDQCDEATIIASLIHEQFTLDDEVALINNFNTGSQLAVDEYQSYQEFRNTIKELVKTTIANDPLQ